jgi:hypothetical protein
LASLHLRSLPEDPLDRSAQDFGAIDHEQIALDKQLGALGFDLFRPTICGVKATVSPKPNERIITFRPAMFTIAR